MNALPDEALLSALAATGSPEPLDELLDRYWGESYRIALRCLNDADRASRLVHEVFAHLALGVPALEGGRTFRGWLHATLLKRMRLGERGGAGPSTTGTIHEPEDTLSLEELRRHLREVEIGERLALVLHGYEGCSPQEVGHALECTVSVARSCIQDGQRHLQEVLTEAGHGQLGPVELAELMREAPKPMAPTPPAASTLVEEEARGPGRARALLVAAIAFSALLIGGALTVLTGEDGGHDAWTPSSPTAPAVVLAPTATPSVAETPADPGAEEVPSPGASTPDPGGDDSESPVTQSAALQCWLRYDDGQAAASYALYSQPIPGEVSPIMWEADASGLLAVDLRPGTYLLRVHDVEMAGVVAEVVVGEGTTTQDVVVPRRFPLRGQVVGPGGLPVEGAFVTLFDSNWTGQTDSDGRFELGDVAVGRLWLGVRAKGYRWLGREWVEHDGGAVKLTLEEGRALVVKGALEPGTHGGNVRYAVLIEGRARRGTTPVIEGRFELSVPNLPPAAEVALALRAAEGTGPVTFSLGSDQGQVDLGTVSFPPGRTIRGQAVAPPGSTIRAGRGLVLVRGGLFEPKGAIGADGSFEVRGLGATPAELELRIKPDDPWSPYLHARLPLDVAMIEGGDLGLVELRPRDHGALRPVALWHASLRRAGLSAQDLVVGVQGASAPTSSALVQAMAAASASSVPAQLVVERKGERREIGLELPELDEAGVRSLFAPASRP